MDLAAVTGSPSTRSTRPPSCTSASSRARSRRATDTTRHTTSVVGEVRACSISSRRCARRLDTTSRPRLPRGGASFSLLPLVLKTNNPLGCLHADLAMFRTSPQTPPSRSKSSGSRLGKIWRRCVGTCGTGRPRTLTGMLTRARPLCRCLVSDHRGGLVFPLPPAFLQLPNCAVDAIAGKAKL
jgi:hypothetical protein